jgi:hypothetical protein
MRTSRAKSLSPRFASATGAYIYVKMCSVLPNTSELIYNKQLGDKEMAQELKTNRNNKQSGTLYFVIRNKSGSYDVTDRNGKFVCACDTEDLALSTANFFTTIDRAAATLPIGVG